MKNTYAKKKSSKEHTKKYQIIATQKIEVLLSLPKHKLPCIREALNMAIVGQKAVNKNTPNGLVAIEFSEDKQKRLEDAHYKLEKCRHVNIEFDITDTGDWINFRIS
jgi:hypothetical protein